MNRQRYQLSCRFEVFLIGISAFLGVNIALSHNQLGIPKLLPRSGKTAALSSRTTGHICENEIYLAPSDGTFLSPTVRRSV